MKKIELLAPAGNMESLKAAKEAGADAIYLGGTFFSARAFAGNFTNDELIEAIKYCHLYGVKVYVTCNILVYEHEVEKFINYVDFLYKNSVDALIIQDIGMLDLIHKLYPKLELHASTQMHIHNLDGVIIANKLGCKRVVLARETPLEKVREIIDKTKVDIEIFAHGSLCVSYSGECLFSSLIGNRSGNRGSCVGSCRLPYKIMDIEGNVLNKGNYPLSMKDLNTLEHVGDLILSGVTSLKLEGRMKSREYVYVVTRLYREAIDSYYEHGIVSINEKLLNDLQRIFSRGYTKGYLFNEDISNIINSTRPNHQGVYIGKVVSFHKEMIDVKLIDDVSINDGLRIVGDREDYGLVLNEFYINKKLVKEAHEGDVISFKVNKEIKLNSQVLLTKDDSLIKEIDRIIESRSRKVMVDIKVYAKLNEQLKLSVFDGINKIEVLGDVVEASLSIPTTKEDIISKINKIGDTIYEIKNLEIDIDENIFIPFKSFNSLRHELFEKLNNVRCYHYEYVKGDYYIDVPDFKEERFSYQLDNNFQNRLSKVMDIYDNLDANEEYLVGELGAFNKLKNIITDYSLNVTNSYSVALLHSLGAKRVTLSLELKEKNIQDLVNAYNKRYHKKPNLEAIKSSRRNVMTLKTNLNKIYHEKDLYLVDRFNNKYPIIEMDNLSYLYEPKRYTSNIDYYQLGVNVIREENIL